MILERQPISAQVPLVVRMFGGFSMTCGEIRIDESSSRTHQVWNLLEYLIANRHALITQQDLISNMWPDGNCDNPINALKNLVYRIRTMLAQKGFPCAKECIGFQDGSYLWNNSIPCQVDIEDFASLARRASQPNRDIRIRIALYAQALQLYQGRFLPHALFDQWIAARSVFYHTTYCECVYHVVALLEKERRFFEAQNICEKAVLLDPFDEGAQQALIRTLLGQGKHPQALETYSRVTDSFFRELGVSPSPAFRSLYRKISRSIHDVETDLNLIKADLQESNILRGAYFCGYEVFKDMYRVEARAANRTGQLVFVGLLTLVTTSGSIPKTELLLPCAELLQTCIRTCLRRADVFAQYSSSQFVLMLPTRTYENGRKVLDRVVAHFTQQVPSRDVWLLTNLQPLDPIEGTEPNPSNVFFDSGHSAKF